jgi:ATP/maltotriose-dependent transcriptional regulator MalT
MLGSDAQVVRPTGDLPETLAHEIGDADIECMALAQLGRALVRQGRVEEGTGLLDEAMTVALGGETSDPLACSEGLEDEPAALALLVRLQLARGDAALAGALLERDGERIEGDAGQLVLRAEVALATGDLDSASRAAERVRDVAAAVARDDLAVEAVRLAGAVAAARGDATGATQRLEDAARRFAALELPYEAARARLALADAQAAAGSPLALASARAARDAFEQLGALGDADRAAALLRGLGVAGRTATRGEPDELTAREREVLRLVAAGLSNARGPVSG